MDNAAFSKKNPEDLILAVVGMPGAGKSEAISYIEEKGVPFIRFGRITDEGVKELGLPLTPENERKFRERIRQELGMGAYAIKSKPKIDTLLQKHKVIAIDGLYSWEEYIYLKQIYPNFILVHVYAEPQKRYHRLSKRQIRPLSMGESRGRDIAELEKLNKGGPISIADYLIENNSDDMEVLYKKIDDLFVRLHIQA